MYETSVPIHKDVVQGVKKVLDALTKVSVSLDLEETLESILSCIQSLIPLDAAGIYLIDPETQELGRFAIVEANKDRDEEYGWDRLRDVLRHTVLGSSQSGAGRPGALYRRRAKGRPHARDRPLSLEKANV